MPSVPIIFKYPLDLSGTSPDNKVVNESHVIGSRRGRLFAPDYGPFFNNTNLVLQDAVTGQNLLPNVDYKLIHLYDEATQATGQPVYAGVQIINPDIGTQIYFTGQYVGGEFSYSTAALKAMIDLLTGDDRPVYWGEIIGVPAYFNPTPHKHSIYETYRWENMIWAINDLGNAIRDGDTASRQLLVQQVTDKLLEFDDRLTSALEAIRRELNYVIVDHDTVLEINRRYLVIKNNVKLTMPSITGSVVTGNWVMIQALLGVEPYIVSNDKKIKCVNGTAAVGEPVLVNDVYQRLPVWIGTDQNWVI
jgi:hypothetical protein